LEVAVTTTGDRTSLSLRDLLVLGWIGELRGLPWATVGWLMARESESARVVPVSERMVRKLVRRLEGQGLVRSRSLGGSMWLELTHKGATVMEARWNRYGLRLGELPHLQAVGEVRFFMEANLSGEWVPEYAFRSPPGQPAAFRRPDGGWLSADGGPLIAVEVELHRKATFRSQYLELVRKLPPDVDEVWWFVASDSEGAWLEGRLQGAGLPCRVQVVPYLELPALHPEGCRCLPCEGRKVERKVVVA
jgi:hypothetical protein